MFRFMFDQKQFFLIITVPNLLTHAQFRGAQLDVIVIVECYIRFGGHYFSVAVSS